MAQVNIRIDDTLKERGEKLFDALGLSFSSAVNIFVSQAVRQGGIPFEITTRIDQFYNATNMKILRKSIQEANDGKLTVHDLLED